MHSKLAISGEHDLRSDGFPIASLNYKRVAGTLAVGCCQDISTCLSHLHLMPQFSDLHARCQGDVWRSRSYYFSNIMEVDSPYTMIHHGHFVDHSDQWVRATLFNFLGTRTYLGTPILAVIAYRDDQCRV